MSDATIDTTAGLEDTIAVLRESIADMQRAMERDIDGWQNLNSDDLGFTHDFRRRKAAHIRTIAAANPIIKRGIALRCAFVWGSGATITVRDSPNSGQDVGAVVQAFLDDEDNADTFVTTDARIELERALCCEGEVFLCLPTDRVTGRVRVRTIPAKQITTIRHDPEDDATVQMFLRSWTDADGKTRKAWYPALSYRPIRRDRAVAVDGEMVPVRWDDPVLHVAVNTIAGRGVGDAFAAVPWAEAYKRFLEDWAGLMHALSRIALQLRTRGDRTSEAAARIAQAAAGDPGQGVALDANSKLEAISTSGARFDADSGRPLAVMVGAALDLPVTTLMGDPGVSGARAVAEQVSADSWAAFDVRRDLWATAFRRICGWVIDSAIIAPAGPLRGTIVRDGDRQTAVLPDGDGRVVDVEFPKRDTTPMLDRIKAIQAVGQSQTLPPREELRLYLAALDVRDADDILDMVTDEDGNFIPLDILDQHVRARLADRGEM